MDVNAWFISKVNYVLDCLDFEVRTIDWTRPNSKTKSFIRNNIIVKIKRSRLKPMATEFRGQKIDVGRYIAEQFLIAFDSF